jgi:hypothetical protein
MAGGLLQLLAYGAEDMYLTAQPQITLFKTVYRRYTNFSIETIEREFTDGPNFGKKSVSKMFRLGDLATQTVLKVTISSVTPNEGAKFAWTKRLGHAILKSIKIDIGGQTIDKHYGEWLDVWWELARTGDKETGYLKMIGDVDSLTAYNTKTKPQYDLFIPLQFWFNRFQGLALPFISIQYHEIYITIEYNKLQNLIITSQDFINTNNISILNASLLINYVHLDDVERRKFSLTPHEYLIEQVQSLMDQNADDYLKRYLLDFTFPTKELIWFMKNGNYTTNKLFLCYTNDNWEKEIQHCSKIILQESVLLLDGPIYELDQYGNYVYDQYGNRIILEPGPTPNPEYPGVWEQMQPNMVSITSNGKITVINKNKIKSLWVNINSLIIGTYSITNKISGTIIVNEDDTIIFLNISSTITIRDVSIPVEYMLDTRITSITDVHVNQFNNYGILINGDHNPIVAALLEFNDQERFVKRDGKFFNYLQPEMHHNNTPADGINVYSFSIYPEMHQPSGTANLSRIERINLSIWFGDKSNEQINLTSNYNKLLNKRVILPDLNFINLNNRFYVFAVNYNIFKVMNGLTVISYTD